MKNLLLFLFCTSVFFSCDNAIKNQDAEVVVENGTQAEIPKTKQPEIKKEEPKIEEKTEALSTEDLLGFWVGYFEPAEEYRTEENRVFVDEGFMWNRANKINISINEIKDSVVFGHSVVAGNNRPFKGNIKKSTNGKGYDFSVKEPGDDKYDGAFQFSINDELLSGEWEAYKNINIKKRVYTLKKKEYNYNPEIMLEYSSRYIDWNKYTEEEISDEDMGEWIHQEFATATNEIYEINASTQILTKAQVENLKKGDLTIIRNSIYARHGYSFKSRPLRVFFDAQGWYIPVHSDIRSAFTDIEKQNIKLLLKYEKNAAEYYDSFGRG